METRMKTYKELKQEIENRNDLKESRLLRKGVSLVFARNAKRYGNSAERHLDTAIRNFTTIGNNDFKGDLKKINVGLAEVANGLIDMRKQIGEATGIVLINSLLMRNSIDKRDKN